LSELGPADTTVREETLGPTTRPAGHPWEPLGARGSPSRAGTSPCRRTSRWACHSCRPTTRAAGTKAGRSSFGPAPRAVV